MVSETIAEATKLQLYKQMIDIRYCEKRAYDLFLQNLIKGTSHLSLGQEAIAAGFGVAMRPDDWTFCTYRGHAHTLARGASMAGASAAAATSSPNITSGDDFVFLSTFVTVEWSGELTRNKLDANTAQPAAVAGRD